MTQPTDSGLKAELLPCPFCGAVPIEARGFVGSEWVECSNQNCAIVSRAIFLKDWNTRPIAPADEAVKTNLQALESQLKQAKTAIKALSNHEFFIQHFPSTAKIFAALSDTAELKAKRESE